jgi:hypothetical protein
MFDAAQCTVVPKQGDAVRLRVGPARWAGRLKALHVEGPETATFVPESQPTGHLWPWDARDVRALRDMAEHAALLAAGD